MCMSTQMFAVAIRPQLKISRWLNIVLVCSVAWAKTSIMRQIVSNRRNSFCPLSTLLIKRSKNIAAHHSVIHCSHGFQGFYEWNCYYILDFISCDSPQQNLSLFEKQGFGFLFYILRAHLEWQKYVSMSPFSHYFQRWCIFNAENEMCRFF